MFAIRCQGAVEVIVPNVPLTGEHADELRETIEHCSSNGLPMVVLNLHDVPLIDSDGLESLLDIRDTVRERGGSVKLASLTPLSQDILRITGVAEHFEVFPDDKAAVRSFVQ
ncbi:STAS domain-containing protein [Bythopirellula polymerisocia]|uniref:STAS domain protein n=1 Tax=Bythopirellula polymerisocia TaxID=2528003 RepID=A0A5C6CY17_9BACT|nr:STAS domain-containing protein [Bythopirellula polymerisocia]TWU29460.1 STAS domain protein [Bythopirellula polymerisocia]